MNRVRVSFVALSALSCVTVPPQARGEQKSVLCTTFPIYQITRNVAQGREAVRVELMLPAQLGWRPPWAYRS